MTILPGIGVLPFFAAVGGPTFDPASKTSGVTLSNGNQTASAVNATNGVRSLTSVSSGSWYVEIRLDTAPAGAWVAVANSSQSMSSNVGTVGVNSTGYNQGGGIFYNNTRVTLGTSFAAGNVIGVHVLFGTGVRFFKNGVAQGSGYVTMPSGSLMFVMQNQTTGTFTATILPVSQYSMPSGASYWV